MVWRQRLWREPYEAEVVRLARNAGEFVVRDLDFGDVLLRERVSLTNDARLGADLLDITDW